MMAKKSAEKKVKTKAAEVTEAVTAPIKKAGIAIRESAERVVQNSAAINAKVIDQAEANAKEAFAAMREAAGAKSVSDIAKIQAKFIKAQSERSMAHVREVGELIAKFGRDAVGQMRGK